LSNHYGYRKTYTPGSFYDVKAKNLDTIWLCGDQGKLIKTTNGGETSGQNPHLSWNSEETNVYQNLSDMEYVNDTTAIIIGENGIILKNNCAQIFNKPIIEKRNDTLFAPIAKNYKWFENGIELNINTNFVIPKTNSTYTAILPSHAKEFHLCVLTEPYLKVSLHTALHIQSQSYKNLWMYQFPVLKHQFGYWL